MQRTDLFDRLRPLKPDRSFTPADVALIDALADDLGMARADAAPAPSLAMSSRVPSSDMLSLGVALETAGHEAAVLEWYLDNAKPPVGTWGIGVTNKSGHNVDRYKDNPQTMERVLEVYIWLLCNQYIPDVVKAFAGLSITEAQFAAALSFHYNTGAILKTGWVPLFRAGRMAEARKFWTSHYLNGGALQDRRNAEAALFFDGTWANDGTILIYDVAKPSYKPVRPRRIDIRADMIRAIAA